MRHIMPPGTDNTPKGKHESSVQAPAVRQARNGQQEDPEGMNGIRRSATARVAVAATAACLLTAGASTATAAAPPAAAVRAEQDDQGTWGDTMTWEGGVSVTVFPPETFTPSPSAWGHTDGNQAVKWRIKVHNGSEEAFSGTLMSVYVKSGDDGESCEKIHDGKISDDIAGSVSPGSSGTAVFGFDVPKDQLGKVDLEVRPSFDHRPYHWVGAVSSASSS